MADDTKVWDHIADLHKKHSELAVQMHEMRSGGDPDAAREGMEKHHAMQSETNALLKELNSQLKELIAAVREDAQADRAEAGSDRKEVKGEKKK